MTAPQLSRAEHGRPAAPVKIVHLGLGNFTRAHQAWYTEHASDADQWGIAAFTGTEEGPGDEIDERMCDEGGEHGACDHHRVKPYKQERLEREEEAGHGVCMDPRDETAYDTAPDADGDADADTDVHA